MKHERYMTALQGLILGSLLSIGGTGCLITAFSLSIPQIGTLYVGCAAVAAVSSLLLTRKWGWAGLAVLAAAAAGWLWHKTRLEYQLWQLVYRISSLYNRAYDCGVFKLVNTPWDAGTAELPLALLGGLLAAAASCAVAFRQGAGIPAALGILALIPCLVVTDTVPEPFFVFLLLLGIILLLLTDHTRGISAHQGNRLTLFAALPVGLALITVFSLLPREGYVNRSQEVRDVLAAWLEDPPTVQEITEPFTLDLRPAQPERLELGSLGQRRETGTAVMEVISDSGGTLYLRGRDYDLYDGAGWTSTRHRVEPLRGGGRDLGRVTIRTRRELEDVYLPYYPAGEHSLIAGRLENTRLETEYTFSRTGLPEPISLSDDAAGTPVAGVGTPEDEAYLDFYRRYTALPSTALPLARELLEGILPDGDTEAAAHAIRDLVRSCAEYDLSPSRMPEDSGDFALWFLTEGERGYCMHFATTAVVLLRAAGIPARYVSGYLVISAPEQTAIVTSDNAHAWAEYFDAARGCWVVLEATPAMDPEPTTVPPEVTRPAQAAVSTLPEITEPPVSETTVPVPAGDTSPTPPPVQNPAANLRIPLTLPLLALAMAAAEGQRWLRRKLRRSRLHRGGPNARALARWQEAERLSRLLKEIPPWELEQLANKAKFSQHTLTEEELALFDSFLRQAHQTITSFPWYKKLLWRYLYGE